MSTKRMKQTEAEIKAAYPHRLVERQGEPKLLEAELSENDSIIAGAPFKIIGGGEIHWIKANGFVKCLKKDSTMRLIVGEKQGGAWLRANTKSYWLKPI